MIRIELFGHTANDFNGDDYLSDRLQYALNYGRYTEGICRFAIGPI